MPHANTDWVKMNQRPRIWFCHGTKAEVDFEFVPGLLPGNIL